MLARLLRCRYDRTPLLTNIEMKLCKEVIIKEKGHDIVSRKALSYRSDIRSNVINMTGQCGMPVNVCLKETCSKIVAATSTLNSIEYVL